MAVACSQLGDSSSKPTMLYGMALVLIWIASHGGVPNASASSIFANGFETPSAADCLTNPDADGDGLRDAICIEAFVPPDPSVVAPPLDPTVSTQFPEAYGFIYSPPNAIQKGVAPAAIEPHRMVVVRGQVVDSESLPLAGVLIRVLDHADIGYTYTRADGRFDMVVNGGGTLTIDYQKPGFLRAQRKLDDLPWQEFSIVDSVTLVAVDTAVANIFLGNASVAQIARANSVIDSDGTRRATVFFPPSTTASMTLPNGTVLPLGEIAFRATEYTVGADGPSRMPATLPPTTGYTYAVELSADQALSAGAVRVDFNQPLGFYLENYLDFPVGMIVPTGYHDFRLGRWIPSDNGLVVQILSVTSGFADLDVQGLGLPASGAEYSELGITSAERERLAITYAIGQELWRVPISHLTPWDHNFPYGPPPGATAPKTPDPEIENEKADDPCKQAGSVIECDNQVVGEVIPITGTPYTLNYRSDRVAGRTADSRVHIKFSTAPVPAQVKAIDVTTIIAGVPHTTRFDPAQNIEDTTIQWDGKDVYGRSIQGRTRAQIKVGYTYEARYMQPAQLDRAFGAASQTASSVSGSRTAREITLWTDAEADIGQLRAADSLGLGGWTLSAVHQVDTHNNDLYLGSGKHNTNVSLPPIGSSYAGRRFTVNGIPNYDGEPIGEANFDDILDIAVLPDGSALVLMTGGVIKLGFDGLYYFFLGGGPCNAACVAAGAGVPARTVDLSEAMRMTVSSNGDVFVLTRYGHVYRFSGGVATIVQYDSFADVGYNAYGLTDIAAGTDGTLYISNYDQIYSLSPPFSNGLNAREGRPIAGVDRCATAEQCSNDWSFVYSGDNGPALSAGLRVKELIADAEGSLYLTDVHGTVRKITADGIIQRFAGKDPASCPSNSCAGYSGDGGPAISAQLSGPTFLAVDAGGNVYVADSSNLAFRRIDSEGRINTIAGGQWGPDCQAEPSAPGCLSGSPAIGYKLGFPGPFAINADGQLLIVDGYCFWCAVHRVSPGSTTDYGAAFVVGSASAGSAHDFDTEGRQLRTRNAITGAASSTLAYNPSGLLTGVTDAYGNVTAIERNGAGQPTAIVSPDGLRTELSLDANGYLNRVENPAGPAYEMAYSPGGLIQSFTNPRGRTSQITYDADGRLTSDTNAASSLWNISRETYANGQRIEMRTAGNRVTQYDMTRSPTGDRVRVRTAPSGVTSSRSIHTDGRISTVSANGVARTVRRQPDPRFGIESPTTDVDVALPSGLTLTSTSTRVVTPVDPQLPPQTMTNTRTVNGRSYSSNYTQANRTLSMTTPTGRTAAVTLDAQGQPTSVSVPGLAAVVLSYDPRGRLSGINSGARTTTLGYDPNGWVNHFTDALNRNVDLTNDLLGRPTSMTLPGNRVVGFGYDDNGNVTGITPPGRPQHSFSYDDADRLTTYLAPAVAGGGSNTTTYLWSADNQLESITRPDNLVIDPVYGAADARLSAINTPSGAYAYSYSGAQVSAISAPAGVGLGYVWDGPLLKQQTLSGAVNGVVDYGWDANFWLTSISVAGKLIEYSYDNDGLMTHAKVGLADLTLTRNVQNGLLSDTALGVVGDHWTFNGYAEPTSYEARIGLNPPFLTHGFVRDTLGRITERSRAEPSFAGTESYSYDSAGRLDTASRDGQLASDYAFDANSNRTSVTYHPAHALWTKTLPCIGTLSGVDPITISGNYDAQDRMTSYGSCSYSYTANGELTSRTDSTTAQTTTYQYDVFGNLRSATLPDTTQLEYVIDGQNRRVGKKRNGALEQGFLYLNQLEPIAELDGAGSVVSTFVYADRPHVPSFMIKGTTVYRIISDHLGSVRLVIAVADGSIVQRMDYDEYGNILEDTNPGFQPFGYAGGIYDRDTRLVRFGARDYDPASGRWTMKDPMGFEGSSGNVHEYANNDSINWIDTNGEIAFIPILIGAAIGYILDYGIAELKEANCSCDDQTGYLSGEASAALGGANGLFGPFADKPRGGVAGGGPSRSATSIFSQANHAASRAGYYAPSTRNVLTNFGRSISRGLPLASIGLAALELQDALSCEQ